MRSKGLYIHVPFCASKCRYCDFYSIADHTLMQAYVDALLRDLVALKGSLVDTVFVGGGTPSVLTPEMWRLLADAIRANVVLTATYEFTVECNPESLDAATVAALREAGVNRLSVGVQSLDDYVLRMMGRAHDAATAIAALRLAASAFDNVNADYMVGWPTLTRECVANDMATLSAYCHHVSVYSLQCEEGTPLEHSVRAGEVALPDDDDTYDLYEAAWRALEQQGIRRYEISNFARDGFECRHNLHCWQYREYIGIGAAAHGFEAGERYYYPCDIQSYISAPQRIVECERDVATQKFEMIMLGLRTAAGLDLEAYRAVFGRDFLDEFAKVLRSPIVARATKVKAGRFAVKDEYLYSSNGVTLEFLRYLKP